MKSKIRAKKGMLSLVFAAGLLFFFQVPAGAVTVDFEYSGTRDYVDDYLDVFDDSVVVGTPFTGRASYDTGLTDGQPDELWWGIYSPVSLSLDVGGGLIEYGPTSAGSSMNVWNSDAPDGGYYDYEGFNMTTHSSTVQFNNVNLYLELKTTDFSVMLSDAPPADIPEASVFDYLRRISFYVYGDSSVFNSSLKGTITSLRQITDDQAPIPEPGTLAMITLALAAVPYLRRR